MPETPDRYHSCLLVGAPGAGKGTQGAMLGALPGFFHISSGDMFRGLDPESELGREIRAIMSSGELVPDELTVRLWADHMRRLVEKGAYDPAKDLLVLDGIPRNLVQAELMDERVEVAAIVFLDATDRDALVRRLKGRAEKEGRADDAQEDVIRNRFSVFDRETAPLMEHYTQLAGRASEGAGGATGAGGSRGGGAAGLVHRVDPMGLPLEVFGRLAATLAPIHARLQGFATG